MDIQDIRRRALRKHIDVKFGGNSRQFAAAIKKPDSQINDMLSSPPRKSFGERIARDIEIRAGLTAGFLDRPEELTYAVADPAAPLALVTKSSREIEIELIVSWLKKTDDRGLAVMIDKAKEIAQQYPIAKQTPKSSL